jgi:hypothetical protein
MQRIFIKKCFLFKVGSVCRVQRFTAGSRNSLKDYLKSQMMPEQVRKWLRQQSKDFCAAGFDALVKDGTNKCIIVGGGYVEKYMFFPGSNIKMVHVSHPFVTYLLTLPIYFFYFLVHVIQQRPK